MAKRTTTTTTTEDAFTDGAPAGSTARSIGAANIVKGEDGRILHAQLRVDPTMLSLSESGKTVTQYLSVEVEGAPGWKCAITLKIPLAACTPSTLAKAKANREAKDAKAERLAAAAKAATDAII